MVNYMKKNTDGLYPMQDMSLLDALKLAFEDLLKRDELSKLYLIKYKSNGKCFVQGSYFDKEGVFSIKSILIQIEPIFLNFTYKEFLPKIELALCCEHEDDKSHSRFIPAYKCKPIG